MPVITHLYRYPVKGLSPEALRRISLTVDEAIPLDRCFALAHGTTSFNPEAPQHLAKTQFLMLMKNERLAALQTIYDHSTDTLYIYQKDKLLISGDLQDQEERQALEKFFADYLGDEVAGSPRIVQAPGHMFSDVDAKVLSCVNLASVRELEKVIGATIDPLRFRANVYFEDVPPWAELEWVENKLTLGTAKVQVLKPIERCAATNVNPTTAQRDLQIPQTLIKTYGHRYMGIYVRVIEAGEVAVRDGWIIL